MADPKIVQRGAMVLEMQPGKYAWCACGESKNQSRKGRLQRE